VGVFETRAFYARFTGLTHLPESLSEWRSIPEENLAAATNGAVFADPSGEFTEIRRRLRAYYPEDIRLKKIAARCMAAGQSGQYNFLRCARRGEWVAAHYALAQYIKASISLAFSLGRRYMPFYKWMHRALKPLPVLGEILYPIYQELVSLDIRSDSARIAESVEIISQHLIEELRRQNLSSLPGDFLFDHGPAVHRQIQDGQLKALNVMSE
jgi:hypothetical protein